MPKTRAEWRQTIVEELGGIAADPSELLDQNLDAALRAALELFNKYRPVRKWFPFEIPSTGAQETFVITFFADPEQTDKNAHPNTFIRKVIDVIFSDINRMISGGRAGFTEGYYMRWGAEGPRLFYQMQVAKRVYEKLTGSQPDWQWNEEDRKLYITSPSRPTRIMALCSRERMIEEVSYDHENDFRVAAVAKAKFYLARILGSRTVGGGIPGPAGAIETDAATLRAEGQEEWKDIESKLARSLTSVPPPRWMG